MGELERSKDIVKDSQTSREGVHKERKRHRERWTQTGLTYRKAGTQ